jgi:hypothetical protein
MTLIAMGAPQVSHWREAGSMYGPGMKVIHTLCCAQAIGLLLQPEDLQNARRVCRHWRQHITGQVEACPEGRLHELDLHPDPHQWQGSLAAVEACLPRMRSAKVGCPSLTPAEAPSPLPVHAGYNRVTTIYLVVVACWVMFMSPPISIAHRSLECTSAPGNQAAAVAARQWGSGALALGVLPHAPVPGGSPVYPQLHTCVH